MLYSSAPYGGYTTGVYGAGLPAGYATSYGAPLRSSLVGGPLVGAGAPLVGGYSNVVGGAPLIGGYSNVVGGAPLVGGYSSVVGGAPLLANNVVGGPYVGGSVVYGQPAVSNVVSAPVLANSYAAPVYNAPMRTSFVTSQAPVLNSSPVFAGPVGGFVNSPSRVAYTGLAYEDPSSSDEERWSPIRGSYTRGLRRSYGNGAYAPANYAPANYGPAFPARRSYSGVPLARYDAYDECGCQTNSINLTSRGAGRLSKYRR